jgi:hypothetical protein
MKKIKLAIIAALISLNATAQTPPFPSIDAAFAKVVMANHDGEIFKSTGLHANKFKLLAKKAAREWNEKYSEENSYFSAYPSTRCQELYWASKPNYPDDECHIIFSAVSPKVGNEEYYSISFEVIYTRLKNSVLTNTWELKWIMFDGAYTYNRKGVDGKFMVDNAIKALLQTKGAAGKLSYETPVDLNGNLFTFHIDFKNLANIDSVTFNKNEFNDGGYYLNFYGLSQDYYSDDECIPYSAGYKKVTANVSVVEKEGKVVETHFRDGGNKNITTINKPVEGFKTGRQLTFTELYKKPTQPKCESKPGVAFKYEAPEDRKSKFLECIKSVMADGKQLKNPEKLKEYLTPGDNTGYDKFVALFKALEDQGYGWKDFRDGGTNQFKYQIFGRKLLNKMYKEDKVLIYFENSVKDVTYFRLDP